jgi:hypothetical protein
MARPQCDTPLVCIMEGTAGRAFPGVITEDPYEGAWRDHLRLNVCGVRNFAWQGALQIHCINTLRLSQHDDLFQTHNAT